MTVAMLTMTPTYTCIHVMSDILSIFHIMYMESLRLLQF
jgi:hypothetical protein